MLAAPAPQDSLEAIAGSAAPAAQEGDTVCTAATAAGSASAPGKSDMNAAGATCKEGPAADGSSDPQPSQSGGRGGQQAETEDEKASTSTVEAHILDRLRYKTVGC